MTPHTSTGNVEEECNTNTIRDMPPKVSKASYVGIIAVPKGR
jgi:hypothetical protein